MKSKAVNHYDNSDIITCFVHLVPAPRSIKEFLLLRAIKEAQYL